MKTKLIVFNKPYQVLTKFTDESNRTTLKKYIDIADIYPAGRLDYNSEGLLLLTNDGQLQSKITEPKYKTPKTYWAQVEGIANQEQIKQLRSGVLLKDGMTKKAKINVILEPNNLWSRNPPIRWRKDIPTSWLKITITEGKNRQVRRMTAAVGLPTLRLIRVQIGQWKLNDLQPGKYIKLPI